MKQIGERAAPPSNVAAGKTLTIFAPRNALGIFAPRNALGIFDYQSSCQRA